MPQIHSETKIKLCLIRNILKQSVINVSEVTSDRILDIIYLPIKNVEINSTFIIAIHPQITILCTDRLFLTQEFYDR